MKIAQIVTFALTALALTSCATPKYKTYPTPDSFKTAGDKIKGKTPKEATAVLGKPMSAFFKNGDKSVYYMVYPMSASEVGMTDLMFNDRLECLEARFEQDKGYKYDGWWSNTGFTCGAIKGEKLDTSLID